MGKATLILVLGSMVLFSIFNTNSNNALNLGSGIIIDRYSEIQAKHNATGMINIFLTKIAEDENFRANSLTTKKLFKGSAIYRVVDTALVLKDSLIKLEVTGLFNGLKYKINTFTESSSGGWVPPFVRRRGQLTRILIIQLVTCLLTEEIMT